MLSSEEAREILTDILHSTKSTENSFRLQEAMKMCGNDMLKRMQIVYPVLMQIQIEVIKKYGYSNDSEGLLKFCQEVAVLEKEDDLLLSLNNEIREIFIPKIPSLP